MNTNKRIGKEFAEITANPPEGIKVQLIEEDLHRWEVHMEGPKESVYAGGLFTLHLTLPPTYPFKPPLLSFSTKIYHPNVSNDDKGSMCLGMLRSDEWKPVNKISAVLEMARGLLREPNPDDAVETNIAEQYRNERGEWERVAREWVGRYAMGKGKDGDGAPRKKK